MLRSSLSDFSDAYILVSATAIVPNKVAARPAANNRKYIINKNCSPFTNCMNEINA